MITFFSIFFIVVLLIFTAKIKLNINYIEKTKYDTQIRYNFNVQIIVFGIIKIFSITVKNEGVCFLWFIIPYNKLIKRSINIKQITKRELISTLKKFKFSIDELYLNLEIGMDNVIFTTVFIGMISAALSCVLAKKVTDSKKYFYKIMPIYNSNNLYFDFSMKISLSFINIMNIVLYEKNKMYNTHFNPNTVKI